MAKTDILDAFRDIPIHPDDYKLLVFLGTIISTMVSIFLWALVVLCLGALVQVCSGQCVKKFQLGVCPIFVEFIFLYWTQRF